MWSLVEKSRNRCGPPCQRCFAPVIGGGFKSEHKRRTRVYHFECFPCRLCKKSGTGTILENGYHRTCDPCTGCGKPFQRSNPKDCCSRRCTTRAPVMDIVYVASFRANARLPKDLLIKIFLVYVRGQTQGAIHLEIGRCAFPQNDRGEAPETLVVSAHDLIVKK